MAIDTFICANSKNGFFSLQNEVINEKAKRVFIIKGGPGTGKSSVIKKVVKSLGAAELIHCSSDPDSLDGAVLNDGTVLFDGTSPHLAEPPVPGAAGMIINTGDYWDAKKLSAKKDKIFEINGAIKAEYRAAYSLLNAAGEVDGLIYGAVEGKICFEKIDEYAKNLVKRKTVKGDGGKITRRFADALCHKGWITHFDSVSADCDEVVCLDDRFGAVSDAVMSALLRRFTESGLDAIAFYSPLSPSRLLHVKIPNARIAFTSKKQGSTRKINCERFLTEVTEFDGRLKFYEILKKSSLEAAVERLSKAKELHDELESYYVDALDKSVSELLSKKIIALIS